MMGETVETITRSRAIKLINDSIDNYSIFYEGYCCNNRKSLTAEDFSFYDEMHEALRIMRTGEDYKNDLKNMPLEDLLEFLLMCKTLVENNDLSERFYYPKGNFEIIEDANPKSQRKKVSSNEIIGQEEYSISNKLNGETDLFTLFVNEVSQEIGNVIHIDEGMRITFRLEALDENAKYKTDWDSRKEGGTEGKSFYSLVSLIKSTADDDSMDREMTFEEIGEYKVSARVYKVMKQSLFASLKELVRDYEFKVVVDESDDLYATMDFFAKLLKALQDVSWKEVAAVSAEEVLKTLPMMVGTIIAVSAVLIALTMTPVGWLIPMLAPVVGTVMQAYGMANGIKDVLAGLYLFTDAVIQTKEAKSSGAMKQASALFTKAFKYVGPNLLMDILMFFGGKAIKNVKGENKIEPVKQKPKPHYKNAKSAVGKNINDVGSIEGYEIHFKDDGTRYLKRKHGMAGKLDQLRADKDGIIHNVDADTKKKAKKRSKNKRDSWTKLQKGNFGEMKMHEHYEKNGYTIISKNPTRDINAKGHHGIDAVYYKKGGHPPYIIGEAKYGSGGLSKLSDGTKQMSSEWIESRLEKTVGSRKLAREIIVNGYSREIFNINNLDVIKITKLK